ncbi:hypothetical protein NZK35_16685 [Stieleria sp. ICT_E10.1]|uniref:hypothetical protein n=1 Tax=Stieleria sedimenti TaxID=2976331 RepID=UPI00217FAEA9|nr:hypothetical protein [Stieleria sedimenti]MCS7468290.1 hypothetical protein [Stieleria sedimenti]
MNRNYVRFSIGFMLFVCLCVAGFLAGNRFGYREGYASGLAKRQAEDPYPKVYEVGDLLRSISEDAEATAGQLEYGSLMAAIETSVFPSEWEALGGECCMGVFPQIETIYVNATSGVHAGIGTFLDDLSSVRLAVAESQAERREMQRRREEWIASILQPVSEKLSEELTLIDDDFELLGIWDVQRTISDGSVESVQWDFVDADTVQVPASDGANKSTPVWYFAAAGSVVVAGKPYIAAETKGDTLVLIPSNEPRSFMVATRANGEP